MTLEQIMEKLAASHKHLIPNTFSNKEYLAIYYAHASEFDFKYLGVDFSSLVSVTDDLDRLDQIVALACYTHDYKWTKLWEVNQAEYNPIWNVDGTETETTVYGEKTNTDNYGTSVAHSVSKEVPADELSERETAANSSTRESYSDNTVESAHTDTVTRTRGGNIGVTMTQQLIEAERRVADFDLMDVIYRDILEAIAIPMFS